MMDYQAEADAIAQGISVLRPIPNDIIILRGGPLNFQFQMNLVNALAEQLHGRGIDGVLVLRIDDDSEMYVLDEVDMERYGWVRKEIG